MKRLLLVLGGCSAKSVRWTSGLKGPSAYSVLPLEQAHVLLATAKAANIDVVLVQQFQIKVAEWSCFLEDGMGLMFVSATGHDDGQVVTGMTRGIAKVTAHYHGGVVEQSSAFFLDLIHFKKELVEMLKGIDLDFA